MNFVKYFHRYVMRVFFWEKIVTEVISRNCIPKASGGKCVVGVHFVLDVSLLIIYFFKIINDFYISLYRRLLLSHIDPFPNYLYPFLPLLWFLTFFLCQLRWSSWTSFSPRTPRPPSRLAMHYLRGRLAFWKLSL